MVSRINSFFHSLREILTRDLAWNNLNKSLSDDMRGMYDFYARNMKSVEENPNKIKRSIKLLWRLFIAFLMKLTPPRRFMYAVAVVFIFVAASQEKITSAVYSFVIVSILLAMELADKLITKDELSVARDIQLSLQPASIAALPGYELAAHSEVAKEVGGDYYDILTLPDGSTLIVIGDVSGKGISSALYVVKMQTALQLFATETSDLRELLIRLNSHMYGQLKRSYFLSLFLVKLQSNGKIELCRAGHPPALLYSTLDKSISWLKPSGFAVGMAASSNGDTSTDQKKSTDFACSLETKALQMQQSDVLFLFTDGVSESVNGDGKEYGQERIAGLIKTFNCETVEKLRERIVNELIYFRAGTDLRDDTTFVLLKRS
jgi:sigma-B regulation protein RsbU (phosphoserine phosphatase)